MNFFTVILTCLPDELHLLLLFYQRQVSEDAIVDGARTERSAHNQDGFLTWHQSEPSDRFILGQCSV